MNAENEKRQELESIPYIVHEFEIAKAEKRGRRLFAALAVAVSALIVTVTVCFCLGKKS